MARKSNVAKTISKFLPNPKRKHFWVKLPLVMGLYAAIVGAAALSVVFFVYSYRVPSLAKLSESRQLLTTKVYAKEGEVLAEYARERRTYVPISEIPRPVIEAFLAAEDTDFYKHGGFDLKGIVRASVVNTLTSSKQGASTITQQVAKTYLLSSERTYDRKIKELILARRIEKAFTKDEILELYLNRIYLGNGAYGIAAAAATYFGKSLDELSLGQRALLGGLPKAPSKYNPMKDPEAAKNRRDVILMRLKTEGFITEEEAEAAAKKDLELNPQPLRSGETAPHFSEHVRRYLLDHYDEDTLYEGGLIVHTTLDAKMQTAAEQAVYKAAHEYDHRHGYRGPIGKLAAGEEPAARLEDAWTKFASYKQFGEPAVVTDVNNKAKQAVILLRGEKKGTLPLKTMTWARKSKNGYASGKQPSKISDVLAVGDIIWVKQEGDAYTLEQIPVIQAALLALDVHTGAIRAMVGGVGDAAGTGFNRATQSKRQVGSAFKPFVYALAFEKGFTPATLVEDTPIELQGQEEGKVWAPRNYDGEDGGMMTLRRGLEQSRNLMTVRMAQNLNIKEILEYARKFGFTSPMERNFSTVLGTNSFSLMELTSAYSVFPNEGKRVEPYFVDRIQDATGATVYHAQEFCENCNGATAKPTAMPPLLEADNKRVIPAANAYQMTAVLQGVVQRGTAYKLKQLGRPMAAKTGTTNDYKDALIVGYTPDVVVGVWMGFDAPESMGSGETGGNAAAPILVDTLKTALAGTPVREFHVPEGVSFVAIDADTGKLPGGPTEKKITEVFLKGTEPTEVSTGLSAIIDGVRSLLDGEDASATMPPAAGTDGAEGDGSHFTPNESFY